jgi:hypothetical protein
MTSEDTSYVFVSIFSNWSLLYINVWVKNE